MSIHHVECAALTTLPASTKLVLMAFADSADKDTRVAFPGLGNVMAWSGLRKSRALEVTRWLVGQGYLVRAAGSTATGPRRRAEYLVFPAGCCPQHGRLDGYAGPDPLNTSAQPDPNQSDPDAANTSGTPDVDNPNGSGLSDVTTSGVADPLSSNTSDLRVNTSDLGAEHVRSGPDPSPPPPSEPPPPPARESQPTPGGNSPGGGGGGDHADEVRRVFDGLRSTWTISASQRDRLAPLITVALQAGWPVDALVAELSSNAAGVRNPYAVLRSRLEDLPEPPRAREAGTRPPWCGTCVEFTRMVEDGHGRPSRCPRCHPLQLAPAASATS